jgi:hypothetical protein
MCIPKDGCVELVVWMSHAIAIDLRDSSRVRVVDLVQHSLFESQETKDAIFPTGKDDNGQPLSLSLADNLIHVGL